MEMSLSTCDRAAGAEESSHRAPREGSGSSSSWREGRREMLGCHVFVFLECLWCYSP